jgi:hypothetical protein
MLAKRLFNKIKWQNTPEQIGADDLVDLICDAIRMLFVISGRTNLFSEDMFIYDEEDPDRASPVSFAYDFLIDEIEWILLSAQIEFYKTVQSNVDDLLSYTTDAMSLSHGDKPYKNISESLDRLTDERNVVWTRMVRFNQLGVVG